MPDNDALQLALQELQTQFAFQDDTVASLNAALASQQRDILALREELALLRQRLTEQGQALADMAPAGEEPPPPHY